MISCCCHKNIPERMRPSMAVEHPWITRRLDDELPLTDF